MFCHWICALLLTLVGLTHGEETMSLQVSQKTFGIIAVQLVTDTYKTLLNESKALQHNITACQTLTSQRNSSCKSCIDKHKLKCLAASNIFAQMGMIAGPLVGLGAQLAVSVAALGQELANGAPQIYNKYGIGAVNGLKNGFNSIGTGFSTMGATLKNGFAAAFNALKYALNMKNWMKGFVKLFGKRRRSDGSSLSESFESRDATEEQELILEAPELKRVKRESIGKCFNETCPVCKSFYNEAHSNDSFEIYRKICGDAFIDNYLAVEDKINKTEELYKVLTTAKVDVLKQVEVGKTTYKVTKLVAYDGTKYVTYYPAHMTFNPWSGTDAGYRAIAEYLLNTYK